MIKKTPQFAPLFIVSCDATNKTKHFSNVKETFVSLEEGSF